MKYCIVLAIIFNFSLILCDDQVHLEKEVKAKPEQGPPKPSIENGLKPKRGLSNDECVKRIYSDCNYPKHFTDEELENVRKFLNHSFTVLSDIKPDKPLCHKIHVRQDWKCLSQQQKERVGNVWKEMYKSRDFHKLAELHASYSPAWHKTPEIAPAHRWLTTEFERIMRSIDKDITLPYWEAFNYGVQPERSSVWETIGHSGKFSNNYAVQDGIFKNLDIYPKVKRHWQNDGTILPMVTPEIVTYILQTARSFPDFGLKYNGLHFQPQLVVGGYEGQLSYSDSPYDITFWLYHAATDIHIFKWQLQKTENLTPLSYNYMKVFDQNNGSLRDANIFTDTLTGVPKVTIKETFWMGFGDYCFIQDQLVIPINNLMKGLKDPKPTAAKRLPKIIKQRYFPAFLSGNFSGISHTLEEVGNCNALFKGNCRPLPVPTWMRNTEQGRALFEEFAYDDGYNTSSTIVLGEKLLKKVWYHLNESGYCSPYVTSY